MCSCVDVAGGRRVGITKSYKNKYNDMDIPLVIHKMY